jgi:hypothetical protein
MPVKDGPWGERLSGAAYPSGEAHRPAGLDSPRNEAPGVGAPEDTAQGLHDDASAIGDYHPNKLAQRNAGNDFGAAATPRQAGEDNLAGAQIRQSILLVPDRVRKVVAEQDVEGELRYKIQGLGQFGLLWVPLPAGRELVLPAIASVVAICEIVGRNGDLVIDTAAEGTGVPHVPMLGSG